MNAGVAVVTGGTRGIGLELCRAAHDLGYEVLTCSRTPVGTEFRFHHLACDLTTSASIAQLAFKAASLGPVRLLVNNAGAIIATDGLDSETDGAVARTFQLNVIAPIALTRQMTPHMTAAGGGLIVNVASLYGAVASPYVLSYSASKAALLSVTKSLAVSLAPFSIRVNAISPGNVDTEMTQSAGDEYVKEVKERTPLKRLGDPTEIGHVLKFLLNATFITGQEIVVDGGIGLVGG